jgi:hypothetical protein
VVELFVRYPKQRLWILLHQVLKEYKPDEYFCQNQSKINESTLLTNDRECPQEMREEVATVIYTSSRIADVPELSNIRKQLTLKFGDKFSERAIGNRDLTVDRRVVSKLSTSTPDPVLVDKYLQEISKQLDVEEMKNNNQHVEPVRFVNKTHAGEMDDLTQRLAALRKVIYIIKSQI